LAETLAAETQQSPLAVAPGLKAAEAKTGTYPDTATFPQPKKALCCRARIVLKSRRHMDVKVVLNVTEYPARIQSTIDTFIKLKHVTELQINVTPPKPATHLVLKFGQPTPQ
jgi:hypothetical protein